MNAGGGGPPHFWLGGGGGAGVPPPGSYAYVIYYWMNWNRCHLFSSSFTGTFFLVVRLWNINLPVAVLWSTPPSIDSVCAVWRLPVVVLLWTVMTVLWKTVEDSVREAVPSQHSAKFASVIFAQRWWSMPEPGNLLLWPRPLSLRRFETLEVICGAVKKNKTKLSGLSYYLY